MAATTAHPHQSDPPTTSRPSESAIQDRPCTLDLTFGLGAIPDETCESFSAAAYGEDLADPSDGLSPEYWRGYYAAWYGRSIDESIDEFGNINADFLLGYRRGLASRNQTRAADNLRRGDRP